jgi:hypothetical protein
VVILRESPRDWVLVILVGSLTLLANLPSEYTDFLHIDRRYLLAGLIAVIVVALVRYLKFTFILVVAMLAIGANLPEELAKEFNVDTRVMMLGLIAVIIVSLSNKFLKLPVGLEKTGRSKSAHGAAALFNAILKGRIAVVQSLIAQGVNVNVKTVTGKTPLMAASYKGYSDIVQLLVEHGADPNMRDSTGDSAVRIAARAGFTRIVDQLKRAGAAA